MCMLRVSCTPTSYPGKMINLVVFLYVYAVPKPHSQSPPCCFGLPSRQTLYIHVCTRCRKENYVRHDFGICQNTQTPCTCIYIYIYILMSLYSHSKTLCLCCSSLFYIPFCICHSFWSWAPGTDKLYFCSSAILLRPAM